MADETAVLESPPVVDSEPKPTPRQPSATTRIGDRYRAEFDRLEKAKHGDSSSTSDSESKPEPKQEAVASKSPSPLDVAVGDAKPVATPPDETAWEKSEALKEFDPKEINWGKAREKIGKQDLEILNLRKEIEVAKAKPVTTQSVEELTNLRNELDAARGKISEQEQAIKAVNAEYSDEYRGLVKGYEKSMGKAIKTFESFSGKGTGDVLADALVMPPGKLRTDAIKAALSNLDADDRVDVRTQIAEVDKAVDVINDFRADLPSKFDEITQRREEAARLQSEQSAKELDANFQKVVSDLPVKNVFFRKVDDAVPGAAEWNSRIDKWTATAHSHLKPGQTFDSSATLLAKGAAYDDLVEFALAERKARMEAEAVNAQYDKSSPQFNGRGAGKTPETKLTPGERYHRALERITAERSAGMSD